MIRCIKNAQINNRDDCIFIKVTVNSEINRAIVYSVLVSMATGEDDYFGTIILLNASYERFQEILARNPNKSPFSISRDIG